MDKELEAALFLFNGNEEKAKVLLQLLKEAAYGTPKKFNVRMDFSEPSCKWCEDSECWLFMPDSRLKCEHNKEECPYYEKE